MTDIALGVVFLLATISLLVLAHEAGHFLAARWCGMRVEDFSLFFGPVVARLGRIGQTALHVRAVPFGGFVRIAGMEPEDVAGGTPVLRSLSDALRSSVPGAMDATLTKLSRDTLVKIDPALVGPAVREAIATGLDTSARLSAAGRDALRALKRGGDLTEAESKLVELVLNADARRADPALFSAKPLPQRAVVIAAGPLASLLFGYLVFCVMGMTAGLPTRDSRTTNQVAEVVPGGEAHRVGVRVGDWITAINSTPVTTGKQLVDTIHGRIGQRTAITVRRGSRTFTATVTPRSREFTDEAGKKVTWGVIGISANIELRRVGVAESVRVGSLTTYAFVLRMLETLSDHKQARESVGGPIAMGQMATEVQRLGPGPMMLLAAQFSISLCILNLLPIPVLDGGQILLILVEAVRRRKLSPREVYGAHAVGLGILALLILAVTYNDIARLI